MGSSNPVNNPIVLRARPTKGKGGVSFDATKYRQMIGWLMYLTVTRPNSYYFGLPFACLSCGTWTRRYLFVS